MLLVVCVYIFHVCILSYVLSLHHFVMCSICIHLFCFFFSSRRRHTSLRISDWSSDVCSSDLQGAPSCGWKPSRHAVHCVADQVVASTIRTTTAIWPQRIFVADKGGFLAANAVKVGGPSPG